MTTPDIPDMPSGRKVPPCAVQPRLCAGRAHLRQVSFQGGDDGPGPIPGDMTTEAQQTRTEEIEIASDLPREPITAARVRELFEDAQYEPRRYSGRCMYGRECLSVTTDSASESVTVVLDVVQACAENGTSEDVVELVDMLRGSRTDSMGRGVVVYWPDISWAECGGEEEEEEEEDCDDGGFRHTGEHDRAPSSGREDFHSDG